MDRFAERENNKKKTREKMGTGEQKRDWMRERTSTEQKIGKKKLKMEVVKEI